MFQLLAERGIVTASPEPAPAPQCSASVNGASFGAVGDLGLWHRRVRHMSMYKLKQIYNHHLVDGFKLRGRQSAESCGCDAFRQAKI